MGDPSPETKPEEKYPLLTVDSAGDNQPTRAVHTSGWSVHYPKKSTWISRWPECMSACWMTIILFGISFLVFYALGMGAYRRQRFIFMKCNTSRPASNVFYHHLVHRGMPVPYLWHSEYLANMATQYPYLHFHVFFLIDDSYATNAPRRNRFLSKLVRKAPSMSVCYKMDENTLQALVEFQRKFQNVNITVIPLDYYMSGTPLRFKWRTIPRAYLPFYARVFSVWQNGGIGIDLAYHSASENNLTSRKMAAILQQHNDGINPESYTKTLDREEDTAMFTMFFGLVNRIFNETCSFINRTLSSSQLPEHKPESLIRTHRAKRDVANDTHSITEPLLDVSNSSADIVEQSNKSNPIMDLPQTPLELLKNVFGFLPNATSSKLNKTDATQVVLFYDFQIVSDNIEPTYLISEPLTSSELGSRIVVTRDGKDAKRPAGLHLLSIDPEGMFLSASSRLHPFLGQLMSAGYQRITPKYVIQDTLLRQCSGLLTENVYCNHIYIL